MQLYVFSCERWQNIEIGYEKRLWAVSKLSEPTNRSRWGKALNMPAYSRGILYCSETETFVMPFVTRTCPEDEVVSNIWPEDWMFPFEIVPLGNPRMAVHKDAARHEWPSLQTHPNITHCLNGIAGRTVFVPNEISEAEWQLMLKHLADPPVDRFPPPESISTLFGGEERAELRRRGIWPFKLKYTANGWKVIEAEEPALDGYLT